MSDPITTTMAYDLHELGDDYEGRSYVSLLIPGEKEPCMQIIYAPREFVKAAGSLLYRKVNVTVTIAPAEDEGK